jgi:hypothetical protein
MAGFTLGAAGAAAVAVGVRTRGGAAGGFGIPGTIGGAAAAGRIGSPGAGLATAGLSGSTFRGSNLVGSAGGAGAAGAAPAAAITSPAGGGIGTAGAGRKIVAAGLTTSAAGSTLGDLAAGFRAAGFASRCPAARFFAGSATATPSPPPGAVFGLAARFGLASTGSSRPRPSLTRSSLAVAVSSGVMARFPLCPIPSSATSRSLLVTPSSFARSMTFKRPAKACLPLARNPAPHARTSHEPSGSTLSHQRGPRNGPRHALTSRQPLGSTLYHQRGPRNGPRTPPRAVARIVAGASAGGSVPRLNA